VKFDLSESKMKDTPSKTECLFHRSTENLCYGFLVAAGAGVAVLVFGALAAGAFVAGLLVALVAAGALAAGLAAGATVATGAGVAVLAALLAFALFAGAASPQAIPRAPSPRTVESTITFFILFNNS
jgi:hypothetical protein